MQMEVFGEGLILAASGQRIRQARLRVELSDEVSNAALGALLSGVSTLYVLFRELDTLEQPWGLGVVVRRHDLEVAGVLRSPGETLVPRKPDFASELKISALEIGTPNFIEWIGESKAIKAIERALQAAAAGVTIWVAAFGGVPPQPPQPDPPPISQPDQREDPYKRMNEALEFTVKARQAYLSGQITLDEYNRLMTMSNTATTEILKGAPVLKVGPPSPPK